MADVDIKFEREGLEGIVAVGTYLGDAMRRHGIRYECGEGEEGFSHSCVVTVTKGVDLLTPRTIKEIEFFGAEDSSGKRLACEAKIGKEGEIVVMTEEKKEKTKEVSESERYIKEFAELPLDKKIADLVRLEAMALGDTISFVLNSPYLVIEKIGDVLAQVGHRLDAEQKKASRPAEHARSDGGGESSDADPAHNGTAGAA